MINAILLQEGAVAFGYLADLLAGVIFKIIFVISYLIAFIPRTIYLMELQNTLKEVSPENQKIEPGLVWLMLIPFFGMFWSFVVVIKIADSLKAEFTKRNVQVEVNKPGYKIGLTYCSLFCCATILFCYSSASFFGSLIFIGGITCWIIYWVWINNYKQKLQQNLKLFRIADV